MAVKRRLVVHGNVQDVGYRTYVKVIARRMRVRGSVRNQEDGTVEIYCECPEGIYKKFLKAIDKKSPDPEDPLQINVEKIEEYGEEWEGFDSHRIRYPFEVEYDGMDLSPLEKETLERSEMAILAMTSMNANLSSKITAMHHDLGGKQDKTLEKQDKMLEKQDITLKEQVKTTESIRELDSHMTERFDWLGERYDEFGKRMERLERDIHEMKEAFIRLVDYLTGGGRKQDSP
ncbi:MAG: acylphosphatase [Thermoplasmata archaeon]|nr:acylphosphatase [Thermoplasmata archaeon]